MCQWERDYGASLLHLEAARAQGHHVEALESRPTLPGHLAIVARAVRDLAGDQQLSGYPFTAVAKWCELVGDVDPFWLIDRLRAFEQQQRAEEGKKADG